MKKYLLAVIDIVLYLIVYIVLQTACLGVFSFFHGVDSALAIVYSQAASAVITVVMFVALRWSTLFAGLSCRRPMVLLACIILFTLAAIAPSEWLQEIVDAEMPEGFEQIFEQMFAHPLGLVGVGLLVPVCEEVVFRGAILGRLLRCVQTQQRWIAIALSALIFAVAHGNLAQIPHAFAMGLLLGWLFYSTGSLVPGIVMHVVNNSAALVIIKAFGDNPDAKLIDLCHGSQQTLSVVVAVAAIAAIAALWGIVKSASRGCQ